MSRGIVPQKESDAPNKYMVAAHIFGFIVSFFDLNGAIEKKLSVMEVCNFLFTFLAASCGIATILYARKLSMAGRPFSEIRVFDMYMCGFSVLFSLIGAGICATLFERGVVNADTIMTMIYHILAILFYGVLLIWYLMYP